MDDSCKQGVCPTSDDFIRNKPIQIGQNKDNNPIKSNNNSIVFQEEYLTPRYNTGFYSVPVITLLLALTFFAVRKCLHGLKQKSMKSPSI